MSELGSPDGGYRFGPYEVRLLPRELLKEGVRIRLQEKPFQVLALLVEKAGTIVTREEFRHRLWTADTHVEFDANLNAALVKVRQALDESAEHPHFIETVSRLGYRFTAEVVPLGNGGGPAGPQVWVDHPKSASSEVVTPGVAARAAAAPLRSWIRRALLAAAALLALAVPSSVVIHSFTSRPGLQPSEKAVLVVLPFIDLSGSKEGDWGDGLTDELITRMSNVNPEKLSVIARTSAMHYKGTRETVGQIGRELGANFALEGTVSRSEGRVRVTAQLVKTQDQTTLWADSYDTSATDLIQLQSNVAGHVTQALAVELLPRSRAATASGGKRNPAAYDIYLQGYVYWNKRGKDNLLRAEKLFSLATQKDPQFELGYVGLAQTHMALAFWGMVSPAEGLARAREAAEQALVLNDSLGSAHGVLGAVNWYTWDLPRAESEFRQAIALDPSNATARQWYAEYLSSLGRNQEAMAEIQRARQIDPLSMSVMTAVGQILYFERQYDQSIDALKNSIRTDPSFLPAYCFLSLSYRAAGKYDQAAQAEVKCMEFDGAPEASRKAFQRAFETGGFRAAWRSRLSDWKQRESREYISPFMEALLQSSLGERAAALASLERAYAIGDGSLALINVFHELDPLRSEPRFKNLLERMHLSS